MIRLGFLLFAGFVGMAEFGELIHVSMPLAFVALAVSGASLILAGEQYGNLQDEKALDRVAKHCEKLHVRGSSDRQV